MGEKISGKSAGGGQTLPEFNPQMADRPARKEPWREKAESIERIGNKLVVRWTNPTRGQVREFLMPFAGRIWRI